MSPPSNSNRVAPAVHGYEFDPVLNRYFKSSPSHPYRGAESGTSASAVSRITSQRDGPPVVNLKPPAARRPTRLDFNPETDWDSSSKRSRQAAHTLHARTCLTSTKPSHLAFPTRGGVLNGRISTFAVSDFEGENSAQVLLLGTACSEALICDFRKLLHRHPSLWWNHVDLSPCITGGTLEPLTAIASKSGVTCFAATSGCVITTPMIADYVDLPVLESQATFTNTTWSLCLTSQHVLMGCERSFVVHDLHRQKTISQNRESSVFAIEKQDESNFLLGTRSGGVIQFDVRSPYTFKKNELLAGRSIFHLKYVDGNQFLVAGSMGHGQDANSETILYSYAKLHDIRYLTSDPTMSLDGWDSGSERSFGLTISKDRNLVCMPGRDRTIKVWDLMSQPVTGFGLQPVATHSTNTAASSVLFVDDLEPNFWSVTNERSSGKRIRPCGPGILYGGAKALFWLGPQAF
ncbi:hypothetical protein H4Q26_001941 [Puccinia striiformis f. sp. tritici PST-130]|nr:hypothetical protein H4Q26_001941 [Puccinia striiformis f. sp. tritici PST-130]